MRKFSAHRIYPVSGPAIPFGIIETDDEGTVLAVRDTGGKPAEEAGLEFYPGIIIPGMVNAHCHLELSHLEGLIPEQTGIAGFVAAVSRIRNSGDDEVIRAAFAADRLMYLQGVSAVGDISNTAITVEVKKKSRILYHTFVELYGLNREVERERITLAVAVAEQYGVAGLAHTLAPHAPYSVSSGLWDSISRNQALNHRISIHHDESPGERELLEQRSGTMAVSFTKAGFDLDTLPAEASRVTDLLNRYLPQSECLLVHNTITDPMQFAGLNRQGLFWVLCPRSNRYIENRLPDLTGFALSGLDVCLGTDSLASNRSLSVLDELREIQSAAPQIPFQTVLRWATLNGARALGMENLIGTLEPGKKPGLVQVPIFDWDQERLTAESRPVRLI